MDLPVSLFLKMIKYVMSNEERTVTETAGSDVTDSQPCFYTVSFVQFRQRSNAQPAKAYQADKEGGSELINGVNCQGELQQKSGCKINGPKTRTTCILSPARDI